MRHFAGYRAVVNQEQLGKTVAFLGRQGMGDVPGQPCARRPNR